jgi:hypothetical protein
VLKRAAAWLAAPVPRTRQGEGAGTGGKSPMGRQNTQTVSRDAIDYTGDNQLPWDKMLNEAAVEQAQYDSYTRNNRTGQVTIPVERAMELMHGPPANKTGGTQKPGRHRRSGCAWREVNATTGKQTWCHGRRRCA